MQGVLEGGGGVGSLSWIWSWVGMGEEGVVTGEAVVVGRTVVGMGAAVTVVEVVGVNVQGGMG